MVVSEWNIVKKRLREWHGSILGKRRKEKPQTIFPLILPPNDLLGQLSAWYDQCRLTETIEHIYIPISHRPFLLDMWLPCTARKILLCNSISTDVHSKQKQYLSHKYECNCATATLAKHETCSDIFVFIKTHVWRRYVLYTYRTVGDLASVSHSFQNSKFSVLVCLQHLHNPS